MCAPGHVGKESLSGLIILDVKYRCVFAYEHCLRVQYMYSKGSLFLLFTLPYFSHFFTPSSSAPLHPSSLRGEAGQCPDSSTVGDDNDEMTGLRERRLDSLPPLDEVMMMSGL